MDIQIILQQMVQLFSLIFLGILLRKIRLIDDDFQSKLTKLLLDVTMPAMILGSVLSQDSKASGKIVAEAFIIAILMYLLLPLLSVPLVKLLAIPKKEQGLYQFMTTFSNIGFMGFPIILALYDMQAVFYAAIFNIIFTIASFTIGIYMMKKNDNPSGFSFSPSMFFTPGTIVSALAVVLYFLPVTYPALLADVVNLAGSITTPLAMILIGSTLGTMKLKDIFDDWHVYPFTIIKQLILPLLFWPLLSLCITDEKLLSVTFILLLMPVANTSVLFATQYGQNVKCAAKTVFLTTLLSIFTIPAALYIIQFISVF